MKKVIIVQARMSSTRLPGKVLKEVLGRPLLEHLIERLRKVRNADEIIIATTKNVADKAIIKLCEKMNVNWMSGSEHDVLARYYEAAKISDADAIIRITSDCPVIDPVLVEEVIQYYIENYKDVDYVSNSTTRTYPYGMDVEIFSKQSLKEAYENAVLEYEREHVTPYIYNRPDKFRLKNLESPDDYSGYRWTVDQEEDFMVVKKIIEALYPGNPDYGLQDMIELVKLNPEWYEINKNVRHNS